LVNRLRGFRPVTILDYLRVPATDPVTADTTNCPETATKLPGGGHENCPLTAMRSARS